MNELKCYEIYDGENHWYTAYSPEDSLKLHTEEFELDEIDIEDAEITEFPLEQELTVTGEDVITKTAGEWLENGRGLICSTSYGYP